MDDSDTDRSLLIHLLLENASEGNVDAEQVKKSIQQMDVHAVSELTETLVGAKEADSCMTRPGDIDDVLARLSIRAEGHTPSEDAPDSGKQRQPSASHLDVPPASSLSSSRASDAGPLPLGRASSGTGSKGASLGGHGGGPAVSLQGALPDVQHSQMLGPNSLSEGQGSLRSLSSRQDMRPHSPIQSAPRPQQVAQHPSLMLQQLAPEAAHMPPGTRGMPSLHSISAPLEQSFLGTGPGHAGMRASVSTTAAQQLPHIAQMQRTPSLARPQHGKFADGIPSHPSHVPARLWGAAGAASAGAGAAAGGQGSPIEPMVPFLNTSRPEGPLSASPMAGTQAGVPCTAPSPVTAAAASMAASMPSAMPISMPAPMPAIGSRVGGSGHLLDGPPSWCVVTGLPQSTPPPALPPSGTVSIAHLLPWPMSVRGLLQSGHVGISLDPTVREKRGGADLPSVMLCVMNVDNATIASHTVQGVTRREMFLGRDSLPDGWRMPKAWESDISEVQLGDLNGVRLVLSYRGFNLLPNQPGPLFLCIQSALTVLSNASLRAPQPHGLAVMGETMPEYAATPDRDAAALIWEVIRSGMFCLQQMADAQRNASMPEQRVAAASQGQEHIRGGWLQRLNHEKQKLALTIDWVDRQQSDLTWVSTLLVNSHPVNSSEPCVKKQDARDSAARSYLLSIGVHN